MKFLLDTHTFIYMDSNPEKLSKRVSAVIQDKTHTLLLSYVSVWELQIKMQLGKLKLTDTLSSVINHQIAIEFLPITLPHIYALAEIKDHHRDPFDRLLIAQAITEKLPIITHDAIFSSYPIRVVW